MAPLKCPSAAVAATLLFIGGCDDPPAPPPPPPPTATVDMHAHFGRPAVTRRSLTNMKVDLAAWAPPELAGFAFEQLDLKQPLDVLVLSSAGKRHMVLVGYALGEQPPDSCVEKAGRLVCGAVDHAIKALARADKWSKDRTDAVIDVSGDYLRANAAPLLAGAAKIGKLSPLPALDKPLQDVSKATFRLRIAGSEVRFDARIDMPKKATSSLPALIRAVSVARPLADTAVLFPPDASLVVSFGGHTPAIFRSLIRNDMTEALKAKRPLADNVAGIWAQTAGAYAAAEWLDDRSRHRYELHGITGDELMKAALGKVASPVKLPDSEVAFDRVGPYLAVVEAPEKAKQRLAEMSERLGKTAAARLKAHVDAPLALSLDIGALQHRQTARMSVGVSTRPADAGEVRAAVSIKLSPLAMRFINERKD